MPTKAAGHEDVPVPGKARGSWVFHLRASCGVNLSGSASGDELQRAGNLARLHETVRRILIYRLQMDALTADRNQSGVSLDYSQPGWDDSTIAGLVARLAGDALVDALAAGWQPEPLGVLLDTAVYPLGRWSKEDQAWLTDQIEAMRRGYHLTAAQILHQFPPAATQSCA